MKPLNDTYTYSGEQLYQIILKFINMEVMVWTNMEGCTHARMHARTNARRYTEVSLWRLCLAHCKGARQKRARILGVLSAYRQAVSHSPKYCKFESNKTSNWFKCKVQFP